MNSAPPEPHATAASAEALTARLGSLSAAMLSALEQHGHEEVYAFLAEYEQVQAEAEPLLSAIRGAASTGTVDETSKDGSLARIEANLRQAQGSQRAVEARLRQACNELREQLRTQRRRSAAVLSYEDASVHAMGGFNRVG